MALMGNGNQGTRSEMNRAFGYYSRPKRKVWICLCWKEFHNLDHMQCTVLEKVFDFVKKNHSYIYL